MTYSNFKLFIKIIGILVASFLTYTSANAQTKNKKVKVKPTATAQVSVVQTPPLPGGCTRISVPTVQQLKNELNKIEKCSGIRICSGNTTFSELENKTIIAYSSISPSNLGQGFSKSKQDEVMLEAKNLAIAQAPDCGNGTPKVIYKLSFIYFVDEDAFNGPLYQVKVNVTYGCCSGLKDH